MSTPVLLVVGGPKGSEQAYQALAQAAATGYGAAIPYAVVPADDLPALAPTLQAAADPLATLLTAAKLPADAPVILLAVEQPASNASGPSGLAFLALCGQKISVYDRIPALVALFPDMSQMGETSTIGQAQVVAYSTMAGKYPGRNRLDVVVVIPAGQPAPTDSPLDNMGSRTVVLPDNDPAGAAKAMQGILFNTGAWMKASKNGTTDIVPDGKVPGAKTDKPTTAAAASFLSSPLVLVAGAGVAAWYFLSGKSKKKHTPNRRRHRR